MENKIAIHTREFSQNMLIIISAHLPDPASAFAFAFASTFASAGRIVCIVPELAFSRKSRCARFGCYSARCF